MTAYLLQQPIQLIGFGPVSRKLRWGDKGGGKYGDGKYGDSIPIHQTEPRIAGLTGSPPFRIVREQNLDKLRRDMKVRCS